MPAGRASRWWAARSASAARRCCATASLSSGPCGARSRGRGGRSPSSSKTRALGGPATTTVVTRTQASTSRRRLRASTARQTGATHAGAAPPDSLADHGGSPARRGAGTKATLATWVDLAGCSPSTLLRPHCLGSTTASIASATGWVAAATTHTLAWRRICVISHRLPQLGHCRGPVASLP